MIRSIDDINKSYGSYQNPGAPVFDKDMALSPEEPSGIAKIVSGAKEWADPAQNQEFYRNYGVPIMAIVESLASKGKSPGTATMAGANLAETQRTTDEALRKSALERRGKLIGVEQEENFQAEVNRLNAEAAELGKPVSRDSLANAYIKYYPKEYAQEAAKVRAGVAPITQGMLEGLDPKKDKILMELATAGQGNEAAAKQFWTEWSNRQTKDKDRTPGPYNEAEQKAMNDFLDRIDKDLIIRRSTQSIAAATPILKVLELKNPIADQALRILIPRLMGEVGNLSESEQAAYGGSPAITSKLNQIWESAATGQLTEENRQYLTQLSKSMYNSQSAVLSQRLGQIVPQTSKITGIPESTLMDVVSTYQIKAMETDTGANTPKSFASVEEAKAAVAAGILKKGEKVIIAGQPGTLE